jgi:hypothetical protein
MKLNEVEKKPSGTNPTASVRSGSEILTLGELLCATSFAQTHFFTFNFTCITSHETSF